MVIAHRPRPLIVGRLLALLVVLQLANLFLPIIHGDEMTEAELEVMGAVATDQISNLPTLEYVEETQVIWEVPADSEAVMFIAHGCSGKATNFWNTSPNCAECKGLPEERVLVLTSLARRYAVITISSVSECWSATKEELEKVKVILSNWINRKGLQGLPVVALGISSGGDLVTSLALQFRFQALVSMVSRGGFESMESDLNFPPTMFVYMPKDGECSTAVKRMMKLLERKGIQTEGIECYEIPLHAHFFSERIPFFNEKTSEKLYGVLSDSGWLDEQSYLKRDGRSINWQMPVKKRQVLSLLDWEDAIQQQLNLAYAYHSPTSLPAEKILHWFDSQISNLVQKE